MYIIFFLKEITLIFPLYINLGEFLIKKMLYSINVYDVFSIIILLIFSKVEALKINNY